MAREAPKGANMCRTRFLLVALMMTTLSTLSAGGLPVREALERVRLLCRPFG